MYERLEGMLDRTKGTDYVVIMGDWNAVMIGEGAEGNVVESMAWEREITEVKN